MDTWQLIATERSRLVDALGELTEADWQAASLCSEWSTKDTLAHIVATTEITAPRFFAGLVTNGFSFQKMTARDIRRVGADSTEQLIERLHAAIPSHDHPPGPVASMLMEIVVHGEDIAFALGKEINHEDEALLATAEFAKNAQPLVGCRKRIAGLRLTATDANWSTGAGAEVKGPLLALVLAISGRKAALDSLTGDGVATLRERP